MAYLKLKAVPLIVIIGICIIPLCYADTLTTDTSWYSIESVKREGSCGINADGSRFDDTDYTAASWDYRFGTFLLVTNVANGKAVIVIVRDRGPAKRLYRRGRKLDLSKSAFQSLAPLAKGVIKVRVEEL